MKLLWPSKNKKAFITQSFGVPAFTANPYYRTHNGTDIEFRDGEEVLASHDGRAFIFFVDEGFGNYVKLFYNKTDYTLYAHLKAILVDENQEVKQGQVIGLADSTGFSSGPHLHWSHRVKGLWVDPMKDVVFDVKREGDDMTLDEVIRDIYLGFNEGQAPPKRVVEEKVLSGLSLPMLVKEIYLAKRGDDERPLKEQIDKLTQSNNSLAATVNSLTVERDQLSQEIEQLKKNVETQDRNVADLLDKINKLNQDLMGCNQKIADLHKDDFDAGVRELDAETKYQQLVSLIPMIDSDKNEPLRALQRLLEAKPPPLRKLTPLEQIIEGIQRLFRRR